LYGGARQAVMERRNSSRDPLSVSTVATHAGVERGVEDEGDRRRSSPERPGPEPRDRADAYRVLSAITDWNTLFAFEWNVIDPQLVTDRTTVRLFDQSWSEFTVNP